MRTGDGEGKNIEHSRGQDIKLMLCRAKSKTNFDITVSI